MQNDGFQEIREGDVEILRHGFQDFNHSFFQTDAKLHAFDLQNPQLPGGTVIAFRPGIKLDEAVEPLILTEEVANKLTDDEIKQIKDYTLFHIDEYTFTMWAGYFMEPYDYSPERNFRWRLDGTLNPEHGDGTRKDKKLSWKFSTVSSGPDYPRNAPAGRRYANEVDRTPNVLRCVGLY